ncbi:MAG: glycosyltransferase family 4 protein [Pseudomonadota bacterium]
MIFNVYSYCAIKQRVGNLIGRRSILPPDINIPARAIFIWNERPDLQSSFNIKDIKGREGLVRWYVINGFVELGLNLESEDNVLVASLGQNLAHTRQLSFLPVSWLMRLFIDRFPSKDRLSLKSAQDQDQLLCWFFAHALEAANLAPFLTGDQAMALLATDDETDALKGGRLLRCIWASTPHLRVLFASPQDPAFRDWCLSDHGLRAFPILTHPLIALARPPARSPRRQRPFGVNLFGHAYARSGISEDMRMACRTLETAQIPFVIRNIAPGSDMREEDAVNSVQDMTLPYAINMFCMPAASTIAAVLKMGRAQVADHYSIGFWPWELPEFPVFWRHAYECIDEIWASTRYTCAAFSRSSPHIVRHVPFAVDTSESDGLGRREFALPHDRFLFGFAFDGLSSFARKAPLATVQAFRQAFAPDDHSVGLVIKGLRVEGDPAWSEIIHAIGDDTRINLITSSLARGSVLDLWRSLDCFISLHRSEGFGRNIAEAMLLEKPVIVTAHSGNMDFTDHATAALVPCALRLVKDGEYPFGTGQVWAEPDIHAAAVQMRHVVNDHSLRQQRVRNGREKIIELYDLKVVGRIWHKRLQDIYKTQDV